MTSTSTSIHSLLPIIIMILAVKNIKISISQLHSEQSYAKTIEILASGNERKIYKYRHQIKTVLIHSLANMANVSFEDLENILYNE